MQEIVENLIAHGGPVLEWLLITAIGGGLLKLIAKIKNDWARERVSRAWEAVQLVVKDVHQTYVAARIKAQAASSPGGSSITAEEAQTARDMAMKKLKELGVTRGLQLALWVLGLSSREKWLETMLEAAVFDAKKSDALSMRNPLPLR